MRILIISHMFPNDQNPISGIWVKDQVIALSKLCSIVVVSPIPYFPSIPTFKKFYKYSKIPKQEDVEGIKVYHPRFFTLPNGLLPLLTTISYFLALAIFIKAMKVCSKIDLIHAHAILPDGFSAALLGRLFKKPVVVTVHGGDLRYQYKKVVEGTLIRFTIKRVDLIISPHFELTEILERMGCRIEEIFNGIDARIFNPVFTRDAEIAQRTLKLSGKKVVLFVALLNEFKDPITFVKAVPFVVSKRNDVVFLIAGDGPLRKDIQNLLKLLQIENYVKILGIRHDIHVLLKLANVFVALSPYENLWSRALCEALMSGVPCVITESGTTHKLSSFLSKIVYLIPPKDHQKLAQAILDILQNPTLAQNLRSNAWNFARVNFDIELTTNRIMRVYQEVIKKSSTSN